MIRLNSTTPGVEAYYSGSWNTLNSAATGGWTLLGTATANNSSGIQFTSISASGYSEWVVVWSDVQPATNATTFVMRISTGSAFKSGASDYAYAFLGIDQAGNNGFPASSGDSSIPLTQSPLVSSTGNFSGEVHIYNPGGTTYTKNVTFQTFGYGTGPSTEASGRRSLHRRHDRA